MTSPVSSALWLSGLSSGVDGLVLFGTISDGLVQSGSIFVDAVLSTVEVSGIVNTAVTG